MEKKVVTANGSINLPTEISWQGSMSENWRFFKQRYEIFIIASGNEAKDGKTKTALLLNAIGDRAIKLYNGFNFEKPEHRFEFEKVIEKFEEHFNPERNEIYERYKFFTRNQNEGESYEDYSVALRDLSSTCNFDFLTDSLIRDRLVCGISDKTVKDRLLRTKDLTLAKAIDICRTSQETQRQLEKICSSTSTSNNIDNLNDVDYNIQKINKKPNTADNAGKNTKKDRYTNYTHECQRCGYIHPVKRCLAFGKRCVRCNGYNHFANKCKNRFVHNVEDNNDERRCENMEENIKTIFFGSVFINSLKEDTKDWTIVVGSNNVSLDLKVDTGAQANLLSGRNLSRLGLDKNNLLECKARLTTYTGQVINCLGKCSLPIKYDGKNYVLDFYVVDSDKASNILGLQSAIKMNLVNPLKNQNLKINEINTLSEYRDLFEGLGCMKEEYDIKLKQNATPVVHASRRVPIAIQPILKRKLDELEKIGVISKVSHPTEWVNSLVIVHKPNGDLRLCLDPKDLNEVIKRQHLELPTLEEITSKLSGAKYFSTLDVKNGFWNIKLSAASSDLCCFNTPFGRYKFLRMPFGICSASEVYQHRMRQILDDLDGVDVYIDDILIWGKTKQEHDKRLKKVFDRLRQENVKLNKDKCKIDVQQLKYLGHIISKDEQHERVFNELKKILTEKPVLQFFDEKLPVVLSVDSSKDGLGAVLLQNRLPVAYASKALSECQQRYAQIEKELLAILFGCERFHQFIFGRHITIETDHNPLIGIIKKPLNSTSPRIQRMLIKLQKYEFNLVYKRGKELYIADTLSRSFDTDDSLQIDLEESNIEANINLVIETLNISKKQLNNVQNFTRNNEEMKLLKEFILKGWPSHKISVPEKIRSYWHVRDSLTYKSNLIFKGNSLVVPPELRKEMLHRAHFPHLGITKTLLRANEAMYWPRMVHEITELVSRCETCKLFSNNNKKETLIPHAVPQLPWEKVGIDLFHLYGTDYLIVIDYYSKYPEIAALKEIKSEDIIDKLKQIFSRHGIPRKIFSDGGPQFSSMSFKAFANQYNFEHIMSSPEYPQSNGMVEREIQTIKNLFKKAIHEKKDPYLILLEFRNTPISNTIASPAENLFNRKIRGIVPINGSKSDPNNYRPVSVLPVISKIFERILYKRLNTYLSEKQFLISQQYGFRSKSSTLTAAIDLVTEIRSQIDKKNFALGIFIDLKKAFDTVSHGKLLLKLGNIGIRGRAFKIFESYLQNRTQVVKIDSFTSSVKNVTCGIPQGSIVGPLMFLIYVNNIININLIGKLTLYADDTCLFYYGSSIQDLISKAQNDLDRLTKEKYLGLWIDDKLTWKGHIEHVRAKLLPILGALRNVSNCIPNKKCFYPKVNRNLREKLIEKQNKDKYFYNRNKKDLRPIETGEGVLFRIGRFWKKGIIKGKTNDRTYKIANENGRIFVRNRFHIKPLNMIPFYIPDVDNQESDAIQPSQQQPSSPSTSYYTTSYGRVVRPPVRYGQE
ncbi:uncharacterized protein K02A2.6-like [Melitaea cinxia]|uniref:uncharacterized protein K02A2.6-like n=1 Tax=Melitaea cinxia TaxID=113334 RepID=UPI001E2701EB|nr:uncharacterized protein K02A2.6-like [Melitaea cinxia]